MHLDLGNAGGADRLRRVLGNLLSGFDNNLARPLAGRRDRRRRRRRSFPRSSRRCDRPQFSDRRLVEGSHDLGIGAVLGIMARSSVIAENLPLWSMRTLSISFLVTLTSIQLPRSGMIRQLGSLRSDCSVLFHHEVDTGAAVQLADHDALGPIDNELAATQHNGQIAEIDLFLESADPCSSAATRGRGVRRSSAIADTRPACSEACRGRTSGSQVKSACRSSQSERSRAAPPPDPGPFVFQALVRFGGTLGSWQFGSWSSPASRTIPYRCRIAGYWRASVVVARE